MCGKWICSGLVLLGSWLPLVVVTDAGKTDYWGQEYAFADVWQSEMLAGGAALNNMGRSQTDSGEQSMKSHAATVSFLDYAPEVDLRAECPTGCNKNVRRPLPRRVLVPLLPVVILALFGLQLLYKKRSSKAIDLPLEKQSHTEIVAGDEFADKTLTGQQQHQIEEHLPKEQHDTVEDDASLPQEESEGTLVPSFSSGFPSVAEVTEETPEETIARLRALDDVEEVADRLAQLVNTSVASESANNLKDTLQSGRQLLGREEKISPPVHKRLQISVGLAMGAIAQLLAAARRQSDGALKHFEEMVREDGWKWSAVDMLDIVSGGKAGSAFLSFLQSHTGGISSLVTFANEEHRHIAESKASSEAEARGLLEEVGARLTNIEESAAMAVYPLKSRAAFTNFAADVARAAFRRLHRVQHKVLLHMYESQKMCIDKCLEPSNETLEASVKESARALQGFVLECKHLLSKHSSAFDAFHHVFKVDRLVAAQQEADRTTLALTFTLKANLTRMEIIPRMQELLTHYFEEKLSLHAQEMKLSVEATIARAQHVLSSVKAELGQKPKESKYFSSRAFSSILKSVETLTKRAENAIATAQELHKVVLGVTRASMGGGSSDDSSSIPELSKVSLYQQLETCMMDSHRLCVQTENLWLRGRLLLMLEADIQQSDEYVTRVVATAAGDSEVEKKKRSFNSILESIKEVPSLNALACETANLRELATELFILTHKTGRKKQ